MSELKPCPFCGGETELKRYDCGDWQIICYHGDGCIMREDLENGYFEDADLQAVIRAWNTRAERTCRCTTDDNAWCFACSECGKTFPRSDLHYAHNHGEINYCPNCGAKVVSA